MFQRFLSGILGVAALCATLAAAPQSAHAAGSIRFCANWYYNYTDQGFGEEVLLHSTSTSSSGRVAAARSWAVIERDGVQVFGGYTDANGCTPPLNGLPGNYVHWRTTAMHNNNGANFWVRPNDSGNWQWFTHTTPISSVVPNGITWTYTPSMGYGENVASAAAVMTELAKRTDMGVKPEVYNVFADQPCQGPNSIDPDTGEPYAACRQGDVLYLGTDNNEADLAFVKHVVAHEVGHLVQKKMFGSLSFNYTELDPDDETDELLCRCNHVMSSNQAHCMQSREEVEASQTEGWAHFFAVDLFNDNASTDPIMAYYKEFNVGDVDNPIYPPMALHFGSPARWKDTFCPMDDRGVEADWTAFFWDINNKGSFKYSFDNVELVYEQACGGSNCFSAKVKWNDLEAAANNVFGGTSQKALRFRNAGAAHGVDN